MCKIMNVFGQNGRENLWMFFQAVIAVYLLILSVIDIRKKSFDFACDCSFMSGTMQQRRTQDDGSRWIVWRSISFFKLVHTRVIWLRR